MLKLEAVKISRALGSPLANVQAHWPLLEAALVKYGCTTDGSLICAVATVGVESGSFKPINEMGGNAYFRQMYDLSSTDPDRRKVAKDLGNVNVGDGILFHGRGLIQTTGRHNYKALSPILGIDLEAHPDALLDPQNASVAFADYWKKHGCDDWARKAFTAPQSKCMCCGKGRPKFTDKACQECCLKQVRRTVNGGLTHYDKFKNFVDRLRK